ncbi:MAG: LemA family protein [Chitinophagaceae bacterium]|jgi:LemA protein|nr:LemA family protein [Chitinophagaceae bacterium]
MTPTRIITIVVVVLLVFLVFGGCNSYNGLITQRNEVDEKWSQVQNQYQRRADLIDNLVNTVKGQVKAENQTLVQVIEARNAARGAFNSAAKVPAGDLSEEKLAEFQKRFAEYQRQTQLFINVVSEQYPDLKSAQAFSELRTEMSGTENRVAVSRMDFNNAVKAYNNKVQKLPTSLFAGILGFKSKSYFSAQPGSENAPKVTDDFMK